MTARTLEFHRKRSYARVRKDRVVRLKLAVLDRDTGEALDFRDDLYYLHGGYGSALPRVEEALEGVAVDTACELALAPEDAYGHRDPDLVIEVPAGEIPEAARRVGARLDGEGPDGSVVAFRVVAASGDRIRVDGNHPLAGRNLSMKIEVLDVREATAEEIEAGYAFPDPAEPRPGAG
ncbi:MAG: peptidylprolyl isomerase [Chromatiales bacterium]|jgi:FKBP-type peptidyl-prolyl cis-trans isomerase SlyD